MTIKLIFALLVVYYFNNLSAISGMIIDHKGNAIQDVIVSTNKKATMSNEHGKYYINLSSYQDSLLFHKLGYDSKKIIPYT